MTSSNPVASVHAMAGLFAQAEDNYSQRDFDDSEPRDVKILIDLGAESKARGLVYLQEQPRVEERVCNKLPLKLVGTIIIILTKKKQGQTDS